MIKVVVRGKEKVQDFMRKVPNGAKKTALFALAEYLLGNESRGLRHYEPYKYIKPFRSYSADPVKAARQRRWIFANLDKIGNNNRTNATANAWQMKITNGGYGITLLNDSEGAKWIWGDKTQTRHQKAVGHRMLSEKVSLNIKGALRAAGAAVQKWLKDNSKG